MAEHEDHRRSRRREEEGDYPYGYPEYDRDDFRGLYQGRREGHGWHSERDRRGVYGQGPTFSRGYERDRNYDYDRGFRGSERDYGYDYGRDRDRDRRSERGFIDRAGDEVRSWFGDEEAERRRHRDEMESHRGRGPRGYRRSDERILDDCNDRLTDDPWLDASDVSVDVKEGEVTLSGTVENRQAKRRAEDLVDDISGVRNVQNNLRVRQQGESQDYAIGKPGSAGVGGAGQGL